MSGTQEINFPSEEIYKQVLGEKQNTEHVILWMLKNNESVEWSHFKEEPINIPQSTLSNYMSMLLSKGFVTKARRGVYELTEIGEKRYNELSREKEAKRRLSYPPDIILDSRTYEDVILWMAYNNNYLKWADFTDSDGSVFINQSSLSKNIKLLLSKGLLIKDDQAKEYRISQLGKVEYSKMLKLYDLDRQSILNEESKRIEDITKKTITFFEKYKIENSNVKFRFLNNVLKLPFANLKGSLDSEEDFNKILLFLSINHPDQYPEYISPEDFSKEFKIEKIILDFHLHQIVEKEKFQINFFKLEVEPGMFYYFLEHEKIEKILSAITEDHITKFTYLNKLYENSPKATLPTSLNSTINSILDDICNNLFHNDLKESLRRFLPDYIKNLAYKIETESQLVGTLDKLEGVAWRDIPDVFQSYSSHYELAEQVQFKYSIDYTSLRILDIFSNVEFEQKFEEFKFSMKKNDFDDALKKVNAVVGSNPDNVDYLFLKAIILSISNRHQEAIHFLKKEFKDHPNKKDEDIFIPYNYILVYDYLTIADFDKALEISKKLTNNYPDHPIAYITRALIFGYKIIYRVDSEKVKMDQVLDDIDQAILLEEKDKNKAKYYYFKSFILKQLKKFEDAIEAIDMAIDLEPENLSLHFMKYNILYDYEKIDEALELVDEGIRLFPEKASKLLTHKAYLYKKKKNYEKGLEIVNDLWEKNPNDLDILNNKVYWHLYKGEKEEALKAGKLLTELDPNDGNFHDSYTEVLTEFGLYEEALKMAQRALELDPLGWFTYNTYFQMARCYKALAKYESARESLDRSIRATQTCFCGIDMRLEWNEKKKKFLAEIDELEGNS